MAVGERFTNPCDKRFKIVVVQSGDAGVNQWHNHKVNHYQDYTKEFGEHPPRVIAVGVQTNSDRTHGRVEAFYYDITLSKN